jgi:D-alanine-D-alanine ligase
MNRTKIILDLLFGGRSQEHDISILSAAAILNTLVKMPEEFIVFPVYLSKEGAWFRSKTPLSQSVDVPTLKKLEQEGISVSPSINPREAVYYTHENTLPLPDIFFPALHGTHGEDGSIQGLFELMGKPFVGSSVLGGSCGMDKETMKRLFVSEGLPVLPWMALHKEDWKNEPEEILNRIESLFHYPVFIKPSSLGSSVGISKATDKESLRRSMELGFLYGKKILVEEGREVREIECAILGNHHLRASCLGEIVPGANFYNFEDKYKTGTAVLKIPAELSSSTTQSITQMALRVYRAIGALGLSRVDFFVGKETEEIFVNEINTFPGFTQISMYPKLFAHSGIAFPDLLRELIHLGFENFNA